MTLEEFRASLTGAAPPAGLPGPLVALWHAARGDWERAHRIVQELPGAEAAWVHAHLHREEGDRWNAGYWYRRAGRPHCEAPLDAEWAEIATALLAGAAS